VCSPCINYVIHFFLLIKLCLRTLWYYGGIRDCYDAHVEEETPLMNILEYSIVLDNICMVYLFSNFVKEKKVIESLKIAYQIEIYTLNYC